MEDKRTKHRGRPRTRTMEEFWAKQREWTKSYYDRNRQKICLKQKIRYYNNKLRDTLEADKVNKGDIARLEAKIADLIVNLICSCLSVYPLLKKEVIIKAVIPPIAKASIVWYPCVNPVANKSSEVIV